MIVAERIVESVRILAPHEPVSVIVVEGYRRGKLGRAGQQAAARVVGCGLTVRTVSRWVVLDRAQVAGIVLIAGGVTLPVCLADEIRVGVVRPGRRGTDPVDARSPSIAGIESTGCG